MWVKVKDSKMKKETNNIALTREAEYWAGKVSVNLYIALRVLFSL